MDKKLFIILGSKGRVASLLAKQFERMKQKYISIPWTSQTFGSRIPGVNQGGISSSVLRDLLCDCHQVIFIDCLWGSNDYKSELKLHSSILSEINSCYPSARYCFISTYEANRRSPSLYRDTKVRLEQYVRSRNQIVLRIGLILDLSSIVKPSSLFSIGLKLFPCDPIYVPVTYAYDLVGFLCSYGHWVSLEKPTLLRVYSEPIPLRISLYPKPCFLFSKSISEIPLIIPPAFVMCSFLVFSWSILRPFHELPVLSFIYSKLQRIYSLLEQQPSIISYDEWLLK